MFKYTRRCQQRKKMETTENWLPNNYISKLNDFTTRLISIPETKSIGQHLDFSRTESESSINVACVLLFRSINLTWTTLSHGANILFKITLDWNVKLPLFGKKHKKRANNFSLHRFRNDLFLWGMILISFTENPWNHSGSAQSRFSAAQHWSPIYCGPYRGRG